LRARFTHKGAGFHEVLKGLANILVIDIQLLFECIEFLIVVDFPPFAAERRVLRLCNGPSVSFFELRGRLFESERGGHGGGNILWTYVASRQQGREGNGKERARRGSNCPPGLHDRILHNEHSISIFC
jgi:hypothetical protein